MGQLMSATIRCQELVADHVPLHVQTPAYESILLLKR